MLPQSLRRIAAKRRQVTVQRRDPIQVSVKQLGVFTWGRALCRQSHRAAEFTVKMLTVRWQSD
jgi:hypothetical protein